MIPVLLKGTRKVIESGRQNKVVDVRLLLETSKVHGRMLLEFNLF